MMSATNGTKSPNDDSSSTTTSNGGVVGGVGVGSSGTNSGTMSPVGAASAATGTSRSNNGEERLKELEAVFCVGPESAHEAKAFSTETLLDILLILYNECCNTSLRKEKTVTDFIELGKEREWKRRGWIITDAQ